MMNNFEIAMALLSCDNLDGYHDLLRKLMREKLVKDDEEAKLIVYAWEHDRITEAQYISLLDSFVTRIAYKK